LRQTLLLSCSTVKRRLDRSVVASLPINLVSPPTSRRVTAGTMQAHLTSASGRCQAANVFSVKAR